MRRTAMKPMSDKRRAAQKANAAKRVYVRRGKQLRCETCEQEFYAPAGQIGRRRFCSRSCMGLERRKERTCAVCGASFVSRNPSKKACRPSCRGELIRRAKTGARNPAFTNGVTERRRHWRTALGSSCACCDSNRRLVQHHVVYEQHVRKRGGDVYDPRNSLTVCFDCHNVHHNGTEGRIDTARFRAENIEFANELLGAYATDYFARYYGPDWFDQTFGVESVAA